MYYGPCGPRFQLACIKFCVVLFALASGGYMIYEVITGLRAIWWVLLGIALLVGGVALAVYWIRDAIDEHRRYKFRAFLFGKR